jgi:hypothetical protein
LLCAHKNPAYSFNGSSFKITKEKERTGRVVVFREYNIMNSFTLECSFHGCHNPETNKTTPLTLKDMQNVGKTLVEVLESHLPREQSNYHHIGSAVLDIFYEEFIKLVPAHVLKREKEEKQL